LDTASHDLAFDGADADDLPRQLLSLVRGGKGHPGCPSTNETEMLRAKIAAVLCPAVSALLGGAVCWI
jgi:hypothetical protein